MDRNSGQFKAPFNQINNEPASSPTRTRDRHAQQRHAYSFLWLDLRAEPIVLSVPAVEKGRYYAVQLGDGNTFNYGYIGSRATGNEAGDYMVVGPTGRARPRRASRRYSGPPRNSPWRATAPSSSTGRHAERGQGPGRLQGRSRSRRISSSPRPPAAPAIEFPKIDKEMVKTNFFEYLDFALQFAPPGPEEKEIRAKLARIGVGPGKTFDFKDLSPEHKAEVGLGMKDGETKVEEYPRSPEQKNINGWKIGSCFGDRAFYNGNWLKRAAGAKGGIYGNDAVEAMYPMTKTLADGEPLDGSKHNYTLTFPAGQLRRSMRSGR